MNPIKNIYKETYHNTPINDDAKLTSMGEVYQKGFLLEGGIDKVDGKNTQYMVVKLYKKEQHEPD